MEILILLPNQKVRQEDGGSDPIKFTPILLPRILDLYQMIFSRSKDYLAHFPFPSKIISLVPSQTELLSDLGLEEEVIAITKFCVHPDTWFRKKTRIGGTKTVDINKVRALQPDLVIANREENLKEQVEEIAQDFPVLLTDVNDLDSALLMIADIAEATGKARQGKTIVDNIRTGFDNNIPAGQVPAAYYIWREPWMTVGGDTFIHDMMQRCGFLNIYGNLSRYPVVDPATLVADGCCLLLLSSEPYPFAQKHIDELHDLHPELKIVLVDGEYFSWYGSRLLKAPPYFSQLLHDLSLNDARG